MPRKLAVKKGAKEGIIGVLASWTFGSVEVPTEEIDRFWNDQSVLQDWLKPTAPSAPDAYANACSQDNVGIWKGMDEEAINKAEKDYGVKVRTEYLTLPTKDGSNEYILTRRLWVLDEEEQEVTPEHPNIARLKYNNQTDKVEVIPFPDFKASKIVKVIEKIANDEYQRQKKVVNGTRHRQAMYRLINEVGGVPYGYGQGMAFIPNTGMEKLAMFQKYAQEVAGQYSTTGHRCGFMLTTVVDADEERKNIAESVRNEVQKRYDSLLEDTTKYLMNQKADLSGKRLEAVEKRIEQRVEESNRIGILKEQYEQMLGIKIQVERQVINIPDNMSGRAAAMVMQMSEQFGGDGATT
jgi:hypothetical protein